MYIYLYEIIRYFPIHMSTAAAAAHPSQRVIPCRAGNSLRVRGRPPSRLPPSNQPE